MEIKFLNELRENWSLFKNMVYLSPVVFLIVFKSVFVSLRNIIKFSLWAPDTPLGECIHKYFIFVSVIIEVFVPLYWLLLSYMCVYTWRLLIIVYFFCILLNMYPSLILLLCIVMWSPVKGNIIHFLTLTPLPCFLLPNGID